MIYSINQKKHLFKFMIEIFKVNNIFTKIKLGIIVVKVKINLIKFFIL